MPPFDVVWIHGSANCLTNSDPPIQVHRYDDDTFILRQNKCVEPQTSFEGPFMYLLFGEEQAILLDTGATPSAKLFPIGKTVRSLIADWAKERGRQSIPLLICHSHAHGDHAQGDAQFIGPDVRIVPPTFSGVSNFSASLDGLNSNRNWNWETGRWMLFQFPDMKKRTLLSTIGKPNFCLPATHYIQDFSSFVIGSPTDAASHV